MADDDVIADHDDYWRHSPEDDLWRPQQAHGWTWLQTALGAPECYSLLDGDGELLGHVYERRGRVLCWAPYTWGEEIYYSTERLDDGGFGGDANRQWHLERIAHALTAWVERQRGAGVDLARLRDTQAYRFECENGHVAETLGEHNYEGQTEAAKRLGRWPRAADAENPRLALQLGRGWRAAPEWWRCEGYRLRDATGQMRGTCKSATVSCAPSQRSRRTPTKRIRRGRAADWIGEQRNGCLGARSRTDPWSDPEGCAVEGAEDPLVA